MATTKKARRAAAALTVATAAAAAVTIANSPASAETKTAAAAPAPSRTEAAQQVALSTSAQSELARHGISVDLSTPAATIQGTTTTDPYRGMQWGYDAVRAAAANTASTGTNVTVAVVDTGTAKVADLTGRVLPGKDFIATGDGTNDQNGHGTGVASIIGAATGNGIGMAGIAPNVRILPVRVCDATGSCPVDAIAAGITWAVDQGAQVINLSLGGASTDALGAAVAYAESRGVPIAASVGNSAEKGNPVLYPGGYDTVEGVAAVDQTRARAAFSETGAQVDIAAPGVGIVQAAPGGGFVAASGTSQASPHVAAVMALAKAYKSSLTPAELRTVLGRTATDLGAAGRDDQFGAGLVDAAAVLTELGATVTAPVNAPAGAPATKAPVTVALAPVSGTSAGGTVVTVTGSGFTTLDLNNPAAVRFGAVNAASFTVLSDSRLTAVTAPGTDGAAVLRLANSAGTSTGTASFTYRSPLTATFDPVTGAKATGGTTVTVTVSGGTVGASAAAFAAEKIVVKVGDTVAPAAWLDPTHLRVTVPAATRTGAPTITLIHDGVVGPASVSAIRYAPTVTTIAPPKVSAAGGETVTITGTGFGEVAAGDPTSVTFGGVNATSFQVRSSTQITAVVPAGVNGPAAVVVTTPGGTATTKVTYRTPLGLEVPAGTVVKASGGAVTLKVTGGTIGATPKEYAAENITATAGAARVTPLWVDATHLKVTLPASTAASVNVALVHDGIAGTPVAVGYAPTVVGLSATSAPLAGGTRVTVRIAGGVLTGATGFTFGGTPAACTPAATGSYTCVVPAAAQAGPTWVSFTASTGVTSRFTAAATFNYTDLD
ncbi:S8 family serine peptidase [Actinoplanes siamensis]|uniref:IPT/TIG domain-containing protein n=1 Tax=Actinoplanes siamensis TaxID=1223317 RepID=A0A919NCD3_9ACTN|nr:S8 family serine peptidase [Actinoplanes siamensis]GIF08343.1 hypothetical protein Asi03nite_58810 [Actinoplanes siamensis]